jgi:hypothetical protein
VRHHADLIAGVAALIVRVVTPAGAVGLFRTIVWDAGARVDRTLALLARLISSKVPVPPSLICVVGKPLTTGPSTTLIARCRPAR